MFLVTIFLQAKFKSVYLDLCNARRENGEKAQHGKNTFWIELLIGLKVVLTSFLSLSLNYALEFAGSLK